MVSPLKSDIVTVPLMEVMLSTSSPRHLCEDHSNTYRSTTEPLGTLHEREAIVLLTTASIVGCPGTKNAIIRNRELVVITYLGLLSCLE